MILIERKHLQSVILKAIPREKQEIEIKLKIRQYQTDIFKFQYTSKDHNVYLFETLC